MSADIANIEKANMSTSRLDELAKLSESWILTGLHQVNVMRAQRSAEVVVEDGRISLYNPVQNLIYAHLYSASTVCQSGTGGSLFLVDPKYDLVGVFLSIGLTIRADGQRFWTGDRFANAITASTESSN